MSISPHARNTSLTLINIVLCISVTHAQVADSISSKKTPPEHSSAKISREASYDNSRLNAKSYIVPGAMILYGVVALGSDALQNLDVEIMEEIWAENPHKTVHLDNYLQFAPAAVVYGLNIAGIKGRHNLRDRTMIYLVSNIVLNVTVFSTKKITHKLRPDSSDYNSFPSGHAAEAFASAEFLRQEFKDVSAWYGVAGYAMAIATGYLRMYNNKHWFSDVLAGAGVGIASTKLAYWLYPKFQHKLFKDKKSSTMILPSYQTGSFGVILVHSF